MSTTPALPASPTPAEAPAKIAATREAIDGAAHSPAIKRALHLILDGVPYREAAREVGFASHQHLYRAAKDLGMCEVHTRELVAGCRRVAHLSGAEIERRLMDDPASVSLKDLAVVNGIALDKVAKYESWGQTNRDVGSAVSAAVDRLAELEGKLKLEVIVERTPSRTPSTSPTIEVAPEPPR